MADAATRVKDAASLQKAIAENVAAIVVEGPIASRRMFPGIPRQKRQESSPCRPWIGTNRPDPLLAAIV